MVDINFILVKNIKNFKNFISGTKHPNSEMDELEFKKKFKVFESTYLSTIDKKCLSVEHYVSLLDVPFASVVDAFIFLQSEDKIMLTSYGWILTTKGKMMIDGY